MRFIFAHTFRSRVRPLLYAFPNSMRIPELGAIGESRAKSALEIEETVQCLKYSYRFAGGSRDRLSR